MVYGVTNDADLVGVEPAGGVRQAIPNFTFATCVADESSAHPTQGLRHRASSSQTHLNGGEVDVYLCGPPPMVEAVRKWLRRSGRDAGKFHYEKFSPSGAVTVTARDARGQ